MSGISDRGAPGTPVTTHIRQETRSGADGTDADVCPRGRCESGALERTPALNHPPIKESLKRQMSHSVMDARSRGHFIGRGVTADKRPPPPPSRIPSPRNVSAPELRQGRSQPPPPPTNLIHQRKTINMPMMKLE